MIDKNIKKFKLRYFNICTKFYSEDQIQKSILPKLARLDWLTLFLLHVEYFCIYTDCACGLLVIRNNIAYLGHLESVDETNYNEILKEALKISTQQNCSKIFAPVDMSIWHSHRIFSDVSNQNLLGGRLYNEPVSQHFYKKSLFNSKFQTISKYITARRKEYTKVIEYTNQKMVKHTLTNFDLQPISISLKNLNIIKKIYKISRAEFEKTPGYYPISFLSFLKLYLVKNNFVEKKFLYGIFEKSKLIGFLYSYIENIESVRSMVLKTIAVDNTYQGHGLTLLFNKQFHEDAIKYNCDYVYYAYVREGIKARGMDDYNMEIYGNYELFVYNIV